MAVPLMIWFAPAATAMSPNPRESMAPVSAAASVPAQGPPTVEPMAPARAPASIAPSIPRLITPPRSARVSPSAARRRGVATRTALVKNDTRRSASISEPPVAASPRNGVGQQHDDDYHRLDQVNQDGRDTGLPLEASGTRFQRREEQAGCYGAQGIEAREQRHGDAGEAVTRREILKQRVGHARHLDPAGKTSDPTGKQQGRGNHLLGVDPAGDSSSERARAGGPELETPQGAAIDQPERHGQADRKQHSQVQPGSR